MPAIRVSLSYRRKPDSGLFGFAGGAFRGLTKNPYFPEPPFALADLAAATEAFGQAIDAADDGGKRLKAARTAKRKFLLKLLRELAAYVQFTAKGDPVKINSAGFDIASQNTAQTPLPRIPGFRIENAGSTKLQLKVKPVKNARMYEVWLHTGDGNWKSWQLFRNTRRMILENLTPGTMYWIRLRALGGSTGAGDWSDAVSHMST